jgi:hypothetical protein
MCMGKSKSFVPSDPRRRFDNLTERTLRICLRLLDDYNDDCFPLPNDEARDFVAAREKNGQSAIYCSHAVS